MAIVFNNVFPSLLFSSFSKAAKFVAKAVATKTKITIDFMNNNIFSFEIDSFLKQS
jgi:hypothetical protein